MSATVPSVPAEGPWNPGLKSEIPKALRPLQTILRPENVFTSVAAAEELAGLTGFALAELVCFRPERLALHELLIRITANFVVPDGPRIEDLGINFRRMATRLLSAHVAPQFAHLENIYDEARRRTLASAERALAESAPGLLPSAPAMHPSAPGRLPSAPESPSASGSTSASGSSSRAAMRAAGTAVASGPTTASVRGRVDGSGAMSGGARRRGWRRLLRRRAAPVVAHVALMPAWGPAEIGGFERAAARSVDPLDRLVRQALARVLAGLFAVHGQAWGTRELILELTSTLVLNEFASEAIGAALEPLLKEAALAEGYGLLKAQERPVVINTKGPSASGKSTLRPLQKRLTAEIGVDWSEFALISPDIWRKQLLDYASLGPAYKYAGAFTADELAIVDQKLDRYMQRKYRHGGMTHLLIDRFRFDSFAPDSSEAGSNLLTRFGETVFLFFLITPPELLVERAWNRGLEVGRYKAVDDTLAHAVDAYTGMPDLFFTWIRRSDKRIRFEFLDNTVPLGAAPRTVAFGDNHTIHVLDVGRLLDIERFGRIDVAARTPQTLYSDPAVLAPARNLVFLERCLGAFRCVRFAQQRTGRLYLELEAGARARLDGAAYDEAALDEDTRVALGTLTHRALREARSIGAPVYLERNADRRLTLGDWGSGAPRSEAS